MQRIEAKSSTGTRKHKRKKKEPVLGPGQKSIVDLFIKQANAGLSREANNHKNQAAIIGSLLGVSDHGSLQYISREAARPISEECEGAVGVKKKTRRGGLRDSHIRQQQPSRRDSIRKDRI